MTCAITVRSGDMTESCDTYHHAIYSSLGATIVVNFIYTYKSLQGRPIAKQGTEGGPDGWGANIFWWGKMC